MGRKVILILVDGMRADAVEQCGHKFVEKIKKRGSFTVKAKTVIPPVTLPCHMSLFHSVDPERHGILTNVYVPQVRPVKGLFEVLNDNGKSCAFCYNWEELRDLGRPGSLDFSYFYNEMVHSDADEEVERQAADYVRKHSPDFCFIYLGLTDEIGHRYGWMTEEYFAAMRRAWDCIEKVSKEFENDYTIFVTADHGGHDRTHGEDIIEDMTIPLFIYGDGIDAGKEIPDARIIDIAPTIVSLMDLPADKQWEGRNLI
ncbi:UNVERIFIED_ORG: hypothetical protein B5F06_04575 [Lacrimispora saccharolytica]